MRHRLPTVVAALTALVACSGADGQDADRETLVVLAASSLTEAFAELERSYEDEHPDIDVQVSYNSSSVLAQQVLEGAPADVLATADETTMASVADEGLADPVPFATNTLTLVTPPDDPGDVSELADLGSGNVSFAICVPEAPCGQAAQALLSLAGVDAAPTTQQENVKAVLTQITTGQVDAALVYVTDALAAGDEVRTVPVDNASEVVNSYPISVITDSEQQGPAQGWVDLVVAKQGQRVLSSYGFGPAAT